MIPDDPDERGRAGEGASGGDGAGRHPAQDRGIGGGVGGRMRGAARQSMMLRRAATA